MIAYHVLLNNAMNPDTKSASKGVEVSHLQSIGFEIVKF